MTTKKRQAGDATTKLRRMYIDCRYGQLHLTAAYPSNGGFDEASPLVFLHAEDRTGADFNKYAVILGTDRSVYAPDLPGDGNSDAPKGRMAITGLALAIVDLISQLRLRRVDLFGCGRGAQVAYELATTHPAQVRRLIVAGSQQPVTAIAQPMLQLGSDPSLILEDPTHAVVAEIRSFFGRA